MIPDEAVEAAAWVVIAGTKHDFDPVKIARASLEAAAPHMLRAAQAEAWVDGRLAGIRMDRTPNPYTKGSPSDP